MRLILKKGQKLSGLMNKNVVFQLTARVELSDDEEAALDKYKFRSEIVYSKENIAPAGQQGSKTWSGIARNLSAMAMNLNLSVGDLILGRTVECKTIGEMLDCEDAIKQACEVLSGLLEACKSFEGETVLEF